MYFIATISADHAEIVFVIPFADEFFIVAAKPLRGFFVPATQIDRVHLPVEIRACPRVPPSVNGDWKAAAKLAQAGAPVGEDLRSLRNTMGCSSEKHETPNAER